MRFGPLSFAGAVVAVAALPPDLHAQTPCPNEIKILASDGGMDDAFGWSVALSGDTAIVGATSGEDAVANSGSAYIFAWSGTAWTRQAELTASDGATDDHFGISVAVSGDTAIVGADYHDGEGGTDQGSAYVYVRSDSMWTQQAKLIASDGATLDWFGWSIALSGDTAIVGAWGNDEVGGAAGAAYIFTRSGTIWTQQAKLTASDGAPGDQFGISVAISGDTAIVGANQESAVGDNTGLAYVFTRSGSTWMEVAKLTASDGAANDFFGSSVAIDGDTAIVGAVWDDDAGLQSGSAYIFTRTGSSWTEQAKLTASDGAPNDWFGTSVSLSGETAIAGSPFNDDAGSNSGSAYIFARTGASWMQLSKLTASDDAASDSFGRSVALCTDKAIVGSYRDDDSGSNSGSAYIYVAPGGFERDLRDLNGDSAVNGVDLAVLLSEWGTNGVSDINNDGATDGADLANMLAAWGAVCP